MFRRPASLRAAFVAFAMLLMTLPALAFLELPNRTQLAFNNILVAIDTVENPSAKQQLAQRRVNKSTAKLFRSGRTLRQCLKDMDKTLRKAGPFFEDAEFDGQSMSRMRATLVAGLGDNLLAAADQLRDLIEVNASDPDDPRLAKSLAPIDKAVVRIVSAATGGDPSGVDAKELRNVFREYGKAVELMERAARRAKKAKFGNFSIVVPPSSL